MVRSNSWKLLEKYAAEILGGIRIHRGGDFSESLPDVIAPLNYTFKEARDDIAIIVECKYRAKQTWINKYKEIKKSYKKYEYIVLKIECMNPYTNMKDVLYILPIESLKDFKEHNSNKIIALDKKIPSYLADYCNQSRKYTNDLNIRDSIQLLYYKAVKDRSRPPFTSFTSIAVIGQKNDRVRLACFFQSEVKFLNA